MVAAKSAESLQVPRERLKAGNGPGKTADGAPAPDGK
jgi:hypothetical protein